MSFLPDNAVAMISNDDVAKYQVVRIADESVVDLLASAGGVDYEKASRSGIDQGRGRCLDSSRLKTTAHRNQADNSSQRCCRRAFPAHADRSRREFRLLKRVRSIYRGRARSDCGPIAKIAIKVRTSSISRPTTRVMQEDSAGARPGEIPHGGMFNVLAFG